MDDDNGRNIGVEVRVGDGVCIVDYEGLRRGHVASVNEMQHLLKDIWLGDCEFT